MSRKRRHEPEKQAETLADYYRLNKDAVEDLVTASEENSPPVSEQEIRKYTRRHGIRLADWVKALLIKWWFPASVCYFFFWGLGLYIQNVLDLLLVTAIALGFVTDLLTNNVLRFIARQEGANDRWMMYPKKQFTSLVLNVVHACVCMTGVYTLYNVLNRLTIAVGRLGTDSVPIGVEPILFGFFFLLWDLLLIGAKRLFGQALQDAKQKVDAGK